MGKISDTLCFGNTGIRVGLLLGDEDEEWERIDPLCVHDIMIMSAKILLVLVG